MSSELSRAARRLSSAFAMRAEPQSRDYDRVRDALQTFLLAHYPFLGGDELLDVVDEVLSRLFETSRKREAPLDEPAAWIFKVARREAISRLRRTRSDSLELDDLVDDDDALARLIDRDASATVIEAAFGRAYVAKDHVAVRIVMAWLDSARANLREPPSRELADDIGYSHTTINEALARFRGYVRSVIET